MEWIEEHWRAALEILLLWLVVYFILRFLRGTRGARVLLGLVLFLLLLSFIGQVFQLLTITWLLGHFYAFIVVALVVIFQPELRRVLAEVGTQPIFFTHQKERAIVDILVKSLLSMSSRKVGALIAVEKELTLKPVIEAGATLDARLSQELLEQIFYPNSPLHDGAAVIQNDRLAAAACIFPLTQRSDLPNSMGTRHRAALGLSEESDAVVIVVSEETGRISVAMEGVLMENLDPLQLRSLLMDQLVGIPGSRIRKFFQSWRTPKLESEPL